MVHTVIVVNMEKKSTQKEYNTEHNKQICHHILTHKVIAVFNLVFSYIVGH